MVISRDDPPVEVEQVNPFFPWNVLRGTQRDLRQETAARNDLLGGVRQEYRVRTFSLTSARTNEEVLLVGDFISISTDGTRTGISVRLNAIQADPIPLDVLNDLRLQFSRLYLTNTAQAGKTLTVFIGGEATADASSQVITAQFENKVSEVLDSTTTPLDIAATYTGAAFSVETQGRIIGSVYSDVAGTLYVEQTNDGVPNYDVQSVFAYAAGALMGFAVEVVGTNARVRFTNGGVEQATFRLYVRARRV